MKILAWLVGRFSGPWLMPVVLIAAALLAAFIGYQQLHIANLNTDIAKCVAMRAADKQAAAEAALKQVTEYRAEEQRRTAAQKEALDEAENRAIAARADAVIADAASGRLYQRLAAAVAAARAATSHPAPAASSPPADDPIGVLADVLGRADARAGLLARVADERGTAGELCQREYDALIAKEATP